MYVSVSICVKCIIIVCVCVADTYHWYILCFFIPYKAEETAIREHLQIDFGTLNVIVTLSSGLPPSPPSLVSHYKSNLLTTEVYNMLVLLENIAFYLLQAIFTLFLYCAIAGFCNKNFITSWAVSPHNDVKCTKISLEMPPKLMKIWSILFHSVFLVIKMIRITKGISVAIVIFCDINYAGLKISGENSNRVKLSLSPCPWARLLYTS